MSEPVSGSAITAFMTALLLLIFAGWLYAPGSNGPALLDDRSTVLKLDALDGDPQQARDLIFGDKSGPLGRPVAVASFVAERYFLKADIAISKSINIALHLIVALLVMWLFALLASNVRYTNSVWLAVLAGGFWLLAPLYVSTVLYAVQRMAILAALFMLLTMITYLYWRRLFLMERCHWPILCLSLFCFVLAIYSKETAIVVLPVLVAMELLWFCGRCDDGIRSPKLWILSWAMLLLGALLVAWIFIVVPDRVLGGYQYREFTPVERILTQARILWDYVGQFYLPDVRRMGLYHDDVVLSKSLREPVATANAVVAWVAVLVFLALILKFDSGRRFAFAVSFFVLGHSTESTVLPLELYYEHRNYYPGIGLALLLLICVGELSLRWRETSAPLLAWLGIGVIALSLQTSSQVQIWSSAPLLRLNHVVFHPDSYRANSDMAALLAELGALEGALRYSAQAHIVEDEPEGDYFVRNLALSCMSGKVMPEGAGPGPEALLSERPIASVTNFHLLVRYLQPPGCAHLDRESIADEFYSAFLSEDSVSVLVPDVYSLLAILENSLARYENAYEYNRRFLALSPASIRGILMQLHFSLALGRVDEAESLKQHLLELQEQGELTFGAQQTLALYLEAD